MTYFHLATASLCFAAAAVVAAPWLLLGVGLANLALAGLHGWQDSREAADDAADAK